MGKLPTCPAFTLMLLSVPVVFVTALQEQVSPSSGGSPHVCHLECETDINGTATFNFCESHSELTIVGRCCLNKTEVGFLVLG
ncbi:hypothetical protein ElyMa_001869200 [Elysia marginata]|uniref:Uncharacterized protein n=1 Tax=Elysia marginata TaxID=1093978 RepID=A0AAV4EMI8_9GAST|nr:hypothetical protein ElyMa_001869200 [Elysia marginata]